MSITKETAYVVLTVFARRAGEELSAAVGVYSEPTPTVTASAVQGVVNG